MSGNELIQELTAQMKTWIQKYRSRHKQYMEKQQKEKQASENTLGFLVGNNRAEPGVSCCARLLLLSNYGLSCD